MKTLREDTPLAAIRPLFSGEAGDLSGLDTAFTTGRFYHVHGWADERGLGFELLPVELEAPLTKRYDGVVADAERCLKRGLVVALDDGGHLGAVIACSDLHWNKTVSVEALYVEPQYRRQGVGRALVEAVLPYARGVGARVLLAETQNVNYPAVQYYLATGWRLCGVNDRYYAPPHDQEIALFFSYNLEA